MANVSKLPTPGNRLQAFAEAVHQSSRDHGFWEGPSNQNVPSKLALIHSEISEALEAYRNGTAVDSYPDGGKPEGLGVELADAVIRILDLAVWLNIDLPYAMKVKAEYNLTRPYKHGGKVV